MGVDPGFSGACVMALGGGYYLTLDGSGNALATADKMQAKWFRRLGSDASFALMRLGGRDDDDAIVGTSGGALVRVDGASDWRWQLQGGALYDTSGRYLVSAGGSVPALASSGTPAAVSFEWPWSDQSAWLTALRKHHGPAFGALPLIQLPIPGSHDSGTYGTGFAARTQNCTILEQLKLGIRYFDLRPRVNEGAFYIHHGIIGSDNVLAVWPSPNPDAQACILRDIGHFLRDNPGEFVILKFQDFQGHSGQDFNTQDHQHFRKLINTYLNVLDVTDLASRTLDNAKGSAVVFYDNYGGYSGKPSDPGGEWGAIQPYTPTDDQTGSIDYIRIMDPYWEDVSGSLADEGTEGPDGRPIDLTQRWQDYHSGNLESWQAMRSGRFFVAQCQMQVCNGNWADMGVPVYFSKAERSAVYNNHLNAGMFVDWLSGLQFNGGKFGPSLGTLRPNVMTLDYVENGGLTDKIVAFLMAIPVGDLPARFAPAPSFVDQGYCRIAFAQPGGRLYLTQDGGWVTYTDVVADALQFRPIYIPGKGLFFMVLAGDYAGYYLSLSTGYKVGLYGNSGPEPWVIEDGRLFSLYSNAYLAPGIQGDAIYANTDAAGAITGCGLDWS